MNESVLASVIITICTTQNNGVFHFWMFLNVPIHRHLFSQYIQKHVLDFTFSNIKNLRKISSIHTLCYDYVTRVCSTKTDTRKLYFFTQPAQTILFSICNIVNFDINIEIILLLGHTIDGSLFFFFFI